MATINLALEATDVVLALMTAPHVPKQVVVEDVIANAVALLEYHLKYNIFPAYDLYWSRPAGGNATGNAAGRAGDGVTADASPPQPRAFARHRSSSAVRSRRKSRSHGSKDITQVFAHMCSTLGALRTLLATENLSDTLVLNVTRMALNTFLGRPAGVDGGLVWCSVLCYFYLFVFVCFVLHCARRSRLCNPLGGCAFFLFPALICRATLILTFPFSPPRPHFLRLAVDGLADMQVVTIEVVCELYARYPIHRTVIVGDLFASLTRLPKAKASLRTFPVTSAPGTHVAMTTALVLQLLQSGTAISADADRLQVRD